MHAVSRGPNAESEPQSLSADVQLRLHRKKREVSALDRLQRKAKQEIASAAAAKVHRLEELLARTAVRIVEARAEAVRLAGEKDTIAKRSGTSFIDFAETAQRLAESVRTGDAAAAHASLDLLSVSPLWLQEQIDTIRLAAKSAGRLELLFTVLANAEPRALSRLYLIATAATIGMEIGRRDEAFALLETARQRCETHPIRFSANDQMNVFARRDKEIVQHLSILKYQGIGMRTESDLFSAANTLSDRLDLDPQLVDLLYAHRKDKGLKREDWESRMRAACCIGHIVWDVPRSPGPAERPLIYRRLVAESDRKAVLGQIDRSRGVLLSLFHGGLTPITTKIFAAEFENHALQVGRTTASGQARIGIGDGMGGGLFSTLRMVSDGKAVLMAPDGAKGNRSYFGNLLGRSIPTAAGAAYIAYASQAFCGWFDIVPDGDRLMPMLATAPKPEKKEGFENYVQRWLDFYWGQLESLLTGDPGKMSLTGRWGTLSAWER